MKQKVVIRLCLSGCEHKCRAKALTKAVSQPGVESAALTGDQLEVVGELDAAKLTNVLRKSMGHAELVSVGPAGGGDKKKDEKKPEVAAIVTQPQPALCCYAYPPPYSPYPVYQVTDSYDFCSIM